MKTVATADQVYVDPSAICRLYLHQPGSREMASWRRRIGGSLPVTHHGRTEIVNAISLAVFRQQISADSARELWSLLDTDFAEGRLTQVDILWRATLNKAGKLSRLYSPQIGTRTLDILHVSSALELNLKIFLTFDNRQAELAKAVGLRTVHPG